MTTRPNIFGHAFGESSVLNLPSPQDLFQGAATQETQALATAFSQVLEQFRVASLAAAPTTEMRTQAVVAASLLMTYPVTGGKRSMPSGQSVIDIERGTISRRDVSGGESLSAGSSQINERYAASGILWADADIEITFYTDNSQSGEILLPQGAYLPFGPFPMNRIVMEAARPFDFSATFSTLPSHPVDPFRFVSDMERYRDVTSTNDFTPVGFSPTGGSLLGSDFLDPIIPTRNIGTKIFLIDNYSDNSADVNIQFQEADGINWVDDPNTTGTSTALAGGDQAFFEANLNARATRLRVKSTTAETAATLRCTYRGISLLR